MSAQDVIRFRLQGEEIRLPISQLERLNVSGPRYTSYPTAPVWEECGEAPYRDRLARAGAARPLSLYTHIPFCEERCHFCGCNVVITRYREQAEKYLGYLFQEVDRVANALGNAGEVIQYHWGGGTPTYLDEDQIERYFEHCRKRFRLAPDAEIAIETDPRVTTPAQVRLLRRLGFNRVSYGVQSFDPRVQQAVNRIQPFEMVRDYMAVCREQGFAAINFDLIYGLPLQTLDGFIDTVEKTIALRPDRIALYSFAHLPKMLPHQNRMDATGLPNGREKFQLFVTAVDRLTSGGYQFIGLDHFALATDELAVAARDGSLHRNFMGHTTKRGSDLVGMGVSGISMFDDAYFQNEKKLIEYYRRLDEGGLAAHRVKHLSADDRLRRDVINDLMCHGRVDKRAIERDHGIVFDDYFSACREGLDVCGDEGLIVQDAAGIRCTTLGRLFVRNVAMLFDAYLPRQPRTFSKTV